MKHIRVKVKNGVCVATMDTPGEKVNSVNWEVLKEMESFFSDVASDPGISSVVVISGRFVQSVLGYECAVADIKLNSSNSSHGYLR